MTIPTSRTAESPEITIKTQLCNGCGLCVSVCSDASLTIEDKSVKRSSTSVFDCIGCGHCMAICPTGAIEISGRELSPEDLYDLSPKESNSSYQQLLSSLQQRRAIREFKDKNVDPELIWKILTAATNSTYGLTAF